MTEQELIHAHKKVKDMILRKSGSKVSKEVAYEKSDISSNKSICNEDNLSEKDNVKTNLATYESATKHKSSIKQSTISRKSDNLMKTELKEKINSEKKVYLTRKGKD